MNYTKRIITIVVALLFCLSLSISAMAANDLGVSYTATLDNSTLGVSDTDQTVLMTIAASKTVDVDSIAFTVIAPEGFGVAVSHPEITFGNGDFNKDTNIFGWSHDWADFEYYSITTLAVITITVPANTPEGEYTLGVKELNLTVDFGTVWEEGSVVTTTLTVKTAHKCTLEHVEAKAANCTEEGNIEYWYCTDEECGKYYSDAQGTTEITKNDTVTSVDANNHVGKEVSSRFFSNGDGTHYEIITCETCNNEIRRVTGNCSGGTATCTEKAVCSDCGVAYGPEPAGHTFIRGTQLKPGNCTTPATYVAKCDVCNYEDQATVITGEKDPTNHTGEVKYVDNGDNTHSATYDCCGAPFVTNEDHDYTTSPDATTCICGAVKAPEHICAHDHYDKTETTHQSICSCGKPFGDVEPHSYDLENNNYECVCGTMYTGWDTEIDGEDDVTVHTFYVIKGVRQFSGWTKIDGYWYYLSTTSGYRAEGLSRVPYPAVEIEGNTYAPNAEDTAYAANKGIEFIDATYAWFLFEDDGKFAYGENGYIDRGDSQGKLIKGMLPWHVGLVEVEEGVYVYFVGDAVNGGNKTAEGDVWVTRTNGITALEEGSCYNFKDGQLSGLSGISNGKYYENSKLMLGKGLTKVGEKYIYVRSAGQLATVQYYIPAGSELASGMYQIDEDGFIIDPKPSNVNGIVDGYYYKNGKIFYAGLIEIDGDIYYVNATGKVVTGTYYVTKTNGLAGYEVGDKLVFGEDGKMETVKNGIVEENGTLYYYEKNHVQYGAGVVELTDAEGKTFYIYVRSNGELATGEYWPTTTNDFLARGKYDWGTDGKYYPAD